MNLKYLHSTWNRFKLKPNTMLVHTTFLFRKIAQIICLHGYLGARQFQIACIFNFANWYWLIEMNIWGLICLEDFISFLLLRSDAQKIGFLSTNLMRSFVMFFCFKEQCIAVYLFTSEQLRLIKLEIQLTSCVLCLLAVVWALLPITRKTYDV